MSTPVSLVILAAGKGTRMKSELAKVLHPVFFSPMIGHVLEATSQLEPSRTVVVVGHQQNAVEAACTGHDVLFAQQSEQLGTGHAVKCAEHLLQGSSEPVMILCGDTPLIETASLAALCNQHKQSQATLTVMTTVMADPTNYGRIVTNSEGQLLAIVEQKDADAVTRQICEINAGIYCVNKDFLFAALAEIRPDNSQKELYLTDIVKIAVDRGLSVKRFVTQNPAEVLGVNSRVELAAARQSLSERRNRELMLGGVSMHNPQSITVSPDSSVGKDTLLQASCQLISCSIGAANLVGTGAILQGVHTGDNVVVGPYCYLTDQEIASNTVIPPYTRL